MKQIAYITDIHLDDSFPLENGAQPRKNWEKIIRDIRSRNIQDIILGGDMGEPSSHEWFFNSLQGFNVDMSLGNHDVFTEIMKHCPRDTAGEGELYYTFENGAFKYIFLDSSSATISVAQMEWLQQQLSTNKAILLFIHHPVIPIRTAIDDVYPLHNREQVRQALQNISNKVTIFCGHYHVTDETSVANITQLETPAASIQLAKDAPTIQLDNSFFGYRLINVHENKIDTELVTMPNR
ncbi:MAG TPA: metallophosphoesterase [Chitinophagaceae bacterium]|nr:metallophosphoesterase [Chitinophagaceae bacterium]